LSGRWKGKNPRYEDIRPSQDSQAAGFVHHQLRTNGAHLLYFLRLNIFQPKNNNKVQVKGAKTSHLSLVCAFQPLYEENFLKAWMRSYFKILAGLEKVAQLGMLRLRNIMSGCGNTKEGVVSYCFRYLFKIILNFLEKGLPRRLHCINPAHFDNITYL
jgi:hypothetical protein